MTSIPLTHIVLWPFSTAPFEIRDLSPACGDEDWVLWVPAQYLEWTRLTDVIGQPDEDDKHISPLGYPIYPVPFRGGMLYFEAHS